jgi:HlyD family secretion protein
VNLAYTIIRSPIDGVVISRNVDVGQTVAASLQAPTLFTIAENLAKMQIHTNVAEADIGRVQPQMPVTFTVDAFPRERFEGVVSQIRNAPQTVQNVVTYNVVVDVENPGQRLRPGMTANVTFVYAETGEVLRVANAALRFRPPPELLPPETPGSKRKKGSPGGLPRAASNPAQPARGGPARAAERRTVWVLEEGMPRPVSIRVGLSDGTFTEVKGGSLGEGDRVITDMTGPAPRAAPRAPGMPPRPAGDRPHGRGILRRL